MSRKVIMINGSFRKKNTHNVLVQIGKLLDKYDFETEIINLFDYNIKDCTGCDDLCVEKGSCTLDDDMRMIMQKIMDSDGVVLGSPVYMGGVTSKFKAFADRTKEWFNKPDLAGIPALFVLTTGITGVKDTLRFLKQFATGFGARLGGSVTRTSANYDLPVRENEMLQFLSLLQTDKRNYKPSTNEVVTFQVQKVLALNLGGDSRKFWEEKNWIDKYYYYDCQIGFFKKIFSRKMFGILSRAMSS